MIGFKHCFLVVSLLVLTWPFMVHAQDDGELLPLNLMETVGGVLDDDTPAMAWQFEAQRDAALSLVVQTVQGDLDPVLHVFDSSGDIVAEHDDLAYPNDINAALEITVPRDDTYTVIIERFDGDDGDTAGEFTLSLLPKYAAPLLWEPFDGQQVWVSGDAGLATIAQDGGLLEVTVQTANTLAWATPEESFTLPGRAYVQVEVAVGNASAADAPDYWEAGIILRQSSPTDYYLFAISSRGDWAFMARDGASTWLHLLDWAEHPALADLDDRATLGVLLDENDFTFYVDGLELGSATANTHPATGGLALSAGTIDQQAVLPVLQFDNLLVTAPLVSPQSAGVVEAAAPLVNWEARDPAVIVAELVEQGLVSEGGSQGMLVPSSFTTITNPGMQALPLGQGRTMTNFVMGTTITLASENNENACGLVFREQDEARYSIGFLDGMGGMGLAEWHDDRFEPAFYRADDLPFTALDAIDLLIVAEDNNVYLFINGEPAAAQTNPAVPGGVGIAALSYDGAYVECRFGDTWLWTAEE